MMRFCLFVGGGLVFTAVAVAQPRYRATELGLRSEPFRQLGVWTGWEGDFPTLYTWTHPIAVNSRGQVLGESRALTNPPEGSTQPWVYWLWDGRETRVIQVPQTLFQRQLPVGAVRTDFPFTMLDDGTVIGSTRWFAPTTHNELGEDYWIWRDGHATLISPRGGDYDTVVDGVTLRKSTYVGVSPNGVIAGGVYRRPGFGSTGVGVPLVGTLGGDGWVFADGATTVLTGFPGQPYEWETPDGVVRYSSVAALGANGEVYGGSRPLGQTIPYSALAAWRHHGGAYAAIDSPPGSDYVAVCAGIPRSRLLPLRALDGGEGVGMGVFEARAMSCNGLESGRDAWLLGSSGADGWLPLGLFGPDYERVATYGRLRETIVTTATANGRVGGRTSVVASGWYDSHDAWYFDGADIHRLGLWGADYQTIGCCGLMRRSSVLRVNAAGVVFGYSVRFPTQSQAVTTHWLLDPATGVLRVAPPQLRLGYDAPLTEGGVVLTSMNDHRPSPPDVPAPREHAALWNSAGVVVNLNDALVTGLPGPDPYLLTTAWYASPDSDADGWPRALVAVAETGYVGTFRTFYLERASECGAADMGSAGGVAEPDGRLSNDDFIVFVDWFFTGDDRADLAGPGARMRGDLLLDNNDFIVFIDQFFAGCGN